MTLSRTSALVRGVFSASLCLVAACASKLQEATADSGGPSQDTGLPAPPMDTAPVAEDTGSPSYPETAPSVPDVQSTDVMAPVPEVAADADPSTGNKPPAVPSTGCASADQLPEGAGTLPGGRRYMVHLPTGYEKTKPYPLVFGNHPNGGNIGMFEDTRTKTVMKDWAILVLTQSQTGDWRQDFPADLGYFDALVPLLKGKLCVDTGRIYSFGFSGGASFSNLLACKRDFLRAVGGGGGIPGYNGYTAADCKPMPAWIDEGMRAGLVELWTAKNGCTQKLPGNRPNCSTYMCTTAPVVYCTNGAHTWPSYGSEDVATFFKRF
jgi:polyhydroxybutyrate depolymerase